MKYGQKPGPIVDSTRGLYRRKLAQLRADETKSREKGEEEEEGEAGVIEEPASSVRLRSNTTKIQHSKEPPSRYPRSTRPCPPQSSSIRSLVLGVALLLVMFAIMVLIYNTLHTTKPCPCPSPTIIPQSNRSQPQSSSTWSSVLSVVHLLVVFAIMLLIYKLYTWSI